MKKIKLLLATAALMLGGSVWAQIDVTSTYLTNAEVADATGWTNGATANDASWTGRPEDVCLNHGWWASATNMYQTVTLPKGTYRLTAMTRGHADVNSNIYVYDVDAANNLASIDVAKNGDSGENNGWEEKSIEFTVDAEKSIQIGWWCDDTGTVWANADYFKLFFLYEDVTSTYITNADFSTTDEWTQSHSSGSYWALGSGLIGTYAVANNKTSTTNATHLDTEYCFGMQCRWKGNYAAFTQTKSSASLPAGAYTLTYDVQNTNNSSPLTYDNFFYVKVGETTYSDNSTEWMSGNSDWTTHTISFDINEATTADFTISLGYGLKNNDASNIGSGSTPHLYVSHLKLTWTSPLQVAKWAWEDALAAAEAAIADGAYANVTGKEKADLQTEIDKAEPTTVDGYNEAAPALITATSTFTAAKTNYDMVVAAGTLAYADPSKKPAITDETTAASLITPLRAYYESHALAEGVTCPINRTSAIANPDAMNANNGWTWGGTKNDPKNEQPWTDASGNSSHWYFDGGNWSASSWTTTMRQTITIPAGQYLLTAKGRAATNTTLTMAVGSESVELPHVGNTGNVFNNGWGDASVVFTADGSDVEIVVIATTSTVHEWFSIADFRLVRIDATAAETSDYSALNAAITAAEAKTLGFNKDEYAPYNNVDVIKAIADAKALDQTADNPKDEVTALTDKLTNGWTANDAEVNAIYDGNFTKQDEHTTGPTTLKGWTAVDGLRQLVKNTDTYPGLLSTNGRAGIFTWGGTTLTYGEQEGYTVPLLADNMYKLTYKIAGWSDGDLPSRLSLTIPGATVYGTPATPTITKRLNEEGAFTEISFYFKTGEAKDYVINLYTNKHTTWADFELYKAVAQDVTLDEGSNYTPVMNYANVTMTRTIKVGYNTVVLPFNLTSEQVQDAFAAPGVDAEVYEFSEDSSDPDNVTINFTKVVAGTISANVPVLLKATYADTHDLLFNGVQVVAPAGDAKVTGKYVDYVGVYDNTTMANGDYFLATKNDVQQIFKSNGTDTVKPFRAYFKAKSAGVKAMLFIDDEATSIDAINGIEAENGAIYNLAGQRLNKMQKGINIINGRKVLY